MSEGPGWGNVGQEIRKVVAKRSGDNVAGTILRFFLFLFFSFFKSFASQGKHQQWREVPDTLESLAWWQLRDSHLSSAFSTHTTS